MSISGTILCRLSNLLLGRFFYILTTRRDGLEDLLHTRGSGVENWLYLLSNSIPDLADLLVEGSFGGEDTSEFVDRSGQTVRNVLEAVLNLGWELIGASLNLFEFGEHSVAELVDLRLGEHVGG